MPPSDLSYLADRFTDLVRGKESALRYDLDRYVTRTDGVQNWDVHNSYTYAFAKKGFMFPDDYGLIIASEIRITNSYCQTFLFILEISKGSWL